MFKHELERALIVGTDHIQMLIDKMRMNNPFNQIIQMEMDDAQTQLDKLRKQQVPNAIYQ